MDRGLAFMFVQPNFFRQNLLWSADSIKTRGEFYSTVGAAPASHVETRDIAALIARSSTSRSTGMLAELVS
jgi:uncharacterized protein YbjT (DUF2867 family)